MVVLTEEFHGLSLKRKGVHEPGLFDDADAGAGDQSSVFSLSSRATKMRRLACPDGPRDGDDQAASAAWEHDDDVAMGEGDAVAPSPSPGAVRDDDERAVVVYGDGGSSRRIDAPRLAPRDDWIRAMLREADSRTVRELLLAGAALERGSEPDLALAVVPWVAPTSAAATEEVAGEEASDVEDGAAAMDFEGQESRPWTWTGTGQGQGQATQAYYGTAASQGLVYRWPQHCWAAPAPAAAPVSPVMWSW